MKFTALVCAAGVAGVSAAVSWTPAQLLAEFDTDTFEALVTAAGACQDGSSAQLTGISDIVSDDDVDGVACSDDVALGVHDNGEYEACQDLCDTQFGGAGSCDYSELAHITTLVTCMEPDTTTTTTAAATTASSSTTTTTEDSDDDTTDDSDDATTTTDDSDDDTTEHSDDTTSYGGWTNQSTTPPIVRRGRGLEIIRRHLDTLLDSSMLCFQDNTVHICDDGQTVVNCECTETGDDDGAGAVAASAAALAACAVAAVIY